MEKKITKRTKERDLGKIIDSKPKSWTKSGKMKASDILITLQQYNSYHA